MSEALSRKIKQIPKNAKTKRALFRFKFFNPEASLKEAANALGISYSDAKVTWHRLKQSYNLASLCPICFSQAFDGKVCHNCGFTAEEDQELQEKALEFPEDHETVIDLKGKGLKLKASAQDIQSILDHGFRGHKDERKFERLKEMLFRELMNYSFDPGVRALALRILRSEFMNFKANYPELLSKHGVGELIVRSTIKRLRPWLTPLSSQRDKVTWLQDEDEISASI